MLLAIDVRCSRGVLANTREGSATGRCTIDTSLFSAKEGSSAMSPVSLKVTPFITFTSVACGDNGDSSWSLAELMLASSHVQKIRIRAHLLLRTCSKNGFSLYCYSFGGFGHSKSRTPLGQIYGWHPNHCKCA